MFSSKIVGPLIVFGYHLLVATNAAAALRGCSLGVDFGTSGVRCCLVNNNFAIEVEKDLKWNTETLKTDSADSWLEALGLLFQELPPEKRKTVERICISGTSSTALCYDTASSLVTKEPVMYNYNVLGGQMGDTILGAGRKAIEYIKNRCPEGSATAASTSTLAKLLTWHLTEPLSPTERLAHQADYVSNSLIENSSNSPFISDWHNALKLGFDVKTLTYPTWLLDLLEEIGIDSETCLPKVVEPGRAIGVVQSDICAKYGLSPTCSVIAGTTDSIAAFLASGADQPGQAVTSLGSTLAVKALSDTLVEDSSRGIYSHRLGDQWLVGGASNVGCVVLREEEFSNEELTRLSAEIDPNTDSRYGGTYYPLTQPGERFPTNDAHRQPVLEPKPRVPAPVAAAAAAAAVDEREEGGAPMVVDRRAYLHGILQSIARIEKEGYDALEELGATPVTEVFTAGGGSNNDMWTKLRSRILGKKTSKASNTDAAYGCALLGLKYFDE